MFNSITAHERKLLDESSYIQLVDVFKVLISRRREVTLFQQVKNVFQSHMKRFHICKFTFICEKKHFWNFTCHYFNSHVKIVVKIFISHVEIVIFTCEQTNLTWHFSRGNLKEGTSYTLCCSGILYVPFLIQPALLKTGEFPCIW